MIKSSPDRLHDAIQIGLEASTTPDELHRALRDALEQEPDHTWRISALAMFLFGELAQLSKVERGRVIPIIREDMRKRFLDN
jgi:hypothetical protein